jgi:hypothetical protein
LPPHSLRTTAVNGGSNSLACPGQVATHSGLLPEDFRHLSRQNMGCVKAGGGLYEISSILQGNPVALTSVESTLGVAPGSGKAIPPGSAAPEIKAAAREAAAAKMAGGGAPLVWWQRRAGPLPLPVGAAIGVAIGAIVAVALVGVVGYVFVYRRWWTVRAATRFQKMHEGPLAAAGGATVSSSAPAAALPSLSADHVV